MERTHQSVISDTGHAGHRIEPMPSLSNIAPHERSQSISNIRIMKEVTNDIQNVMYLYRNFYQHKNNRILVIDDEEFCISAMKALLFKLGIDIQF